MLFSSVRTARPLVPLGSTNARHGDGPDCHRKLPPGVEFTEHFPELLLQVGDTPAIHPSQARVSRRFEGVPSPIDLETRTSPLGGDSRLDERLVGLPTVVFQQHLAP